MKTISNKLHYATLAALIVSNLSVFLLAIILAQGLGFSLGAMSLTQLYKTPTQAAQDKKPALREPEYVPNRVIIKLKSDERTVKFDIDRSQSIAKAVESFPFMRALREMTNIKKIEPLIDIKTKSGENRVAAFNRRTKEVQQQFAKRTKRLSLTAKTQKEVNLASVYILEFDQSVDNIPALAKGLQMQFSDDIAYAEPDYLAYTTSDIAADDQASEGSPIMLAAATKNQANPSSGKGSKSMIFVHLTMTPSDDPQIFSFTTTGTGYQSFTLSATTNENIQYLAPGTYSAWETVPTGWVLNSAICYDGSLQLNPASINLLAGHTIGCTFTNTKATIGHLIVQKTTVPAGDPTNFSINATGSGTITGGGAGVVSDGIDKNYIVTAGTYSVAETVPSGWTKTGDTCQNITIAAGQTKFCLLSNTISSPGSDPDPSQPRIIPNDTYADPDPNDDVWALSTWNTTQPFLWGMKKIKADYAWVTTTSTESVIVAVVDTGLDINHEDIQGNVWSNTDEISGNGADDDHNGYIDDTYGWDFVSNDNIPQDGHGHGSHVSGTIGAVGNNSLGVAGVNWHIKIMPVKGLSDGGSGVDTWLANALYYAANNGADVINNSWGGSGRSQAIEDAINYAHNVQGVVVVAAAGNSNVSLNDYFFQPASFENVITVSAFDENDYRASFSNFGTKIDVAAPGVNILSLRAAGTSMGTVFDAKYTRAAGTSMASPHVAGLAGLILAHDPTLTTEQVRQVLRSSADDDAANAGWDIHAGYGRINAQAALAVTAPLEVNITLPETNTVSKGQMISIIGTASGPNFAGYIVEYGVGTSPSTWTQFGSGTTAVVNGTLATLDTSSLFDGPFTIRLTATNTANQSYYDRTFVNVDKVYITNPSVGKVFAPNTSVDIIGSATGSGFQNYTITWGSGANPTSWSSSGITLANGGLQQKTDSVLAQWNTASLPTGVYQLRSVATRTGGTDEHIQRNVYIDGRFHAGWPKKDIRWNWASAAVADLDGDGTQEIIIPSNKPSIALHVLKHDGSEMTGWPKAFSSGIIGNPAVYDLNADGKLEIVVSDSYSVYALSVTGSTLWKKELSGFDVPGATPTIADINNDGYAEVIIFSFGSGNVFRLNILNYNGISLSGWPRTVSQVNLNDPVAVYDINSDNALEMIYPSRSGVNSNPELHVQKLDGSELAGWPRPLYTQGPSYAMGPVSIGDMDSDGAVELVAIGNKYNSTYNVDRTAIYIYRSNGTPAFGSPFDQYSSSCVGTNGIGYPGTHIALADMDNNGDLELIIPENSSDSVVVLNHDGSVYGDCGWPQNMYYTRQVLWFGNAPLDPSPAIADIDGDGGLEIIQTNNQIVDGDAQKVYAWHANGTPVTGWPIPISLPDDNYNFMQSSPVIADLDNDGKIEVIVPALDGAYIWDLPAIYNRARAPWVAFGHDTLHTGVYPSPNQTPQFYPPIGALKKATRGENLWFDVEATNPMNQNLVISALNLPPGATLTDRHDGTGRFEWSSASQVNGSYTVTFQVQDAATQAIKDSHDVVITVDFDTTPPAVTLTNPTDTMVVTRNTVTLEATATDANGVSQVQFFEDETTPRLLGTDTTNPYSISSTFTQGSHRVYATASDLVGNVATSTMNTFTVVPDITTTITWPANNSFVGFATINASAASTNGISKVEFYEANTTPRLLGTDTTSPYSTLPTLIDGQHQVYSKAYDRVGNTATSTTILFTLDMTSPTIGITSPVTGSSVSGIINVIASVSDTNAISRVDFRYIPEKSGGIQDPGGGTGPVTFRSVTGLPYQASLDTRTMTNGVYTIEVAALDIAGNYGYSRITITVNNPGGGSGDRPKYIVP